MSRSRRARWGSLFEDPKYRFVAFDNVGDLVVSTVWIGLDHRLQTFDPGPPLIFETIVFHVPQGDDNWISKMHERYPTLDDAIRGHERILGLVQEVES